MAPCKGPHLAIEAARLARRPPQARRRDPADVSASYWEQQVLPRIDGDQVEYVGEADRAMKNELLSRRTRAALSDPVGGAVRPGDDRGDGLRHAGARVRRRGGRRGRRATASTAGSAATSRTMAARIASPRHLAGVVPRVRGAALLGRANDRAATSGVRAGAATARPAVDGRDWRPDGRCHPGPGPVLHPRDGVEGRASAPRCSSTTTRSRVFDYSGDIGAFGTGEQGLYHEGTRYLSRFRLRLNGHRPLLLSARVKDDNELFGADLTNPDIPLGGRPSCCRAISSTCSARGSCGTARGTSASGSGTTAARRCASSLTFDIDADFADIFEVRGTPRDAPRRSGSTRSSTAARCASATAASTTKSAGR